MHRPWLTAESLARIAGLWAGWYVSSPGNATDRFQIYLIADADARRPKLRHYQPQLECFAEDRVCGNYRAPSAGEAAHRGVRSTWLEGVRLIIQGARLAEKEAMHSSRMLEYDSVVEYAPGWNVWAAWRI